ncbi:type IV pilus biogenesis/stability protein PilW [Formivibrio citricus]|nr:type IV pilus biogenesis/stability protein PilW [Formivibrio citricus]
MQRLMLTMLALTAVLPAAQAETSSEERANIRTQLAAEYFKRRQFGVAMEEARKAVVADPKYAPAYNMLALINMELREDSAARDYFRQASALAPADSDIHHNYGYFLCERGETSAGIAEYMAALKNPLYPVPDKTLVAAGVCAEKAGQQKEAQGYFERALRYRPENALAKLSLANILLAQGKLPESRRYLMELVKIQNPAPVEVLWLGVRVERKLGNRPGELQYADQLRRLYPESLEASRLLAGQY